MQSIVTVWKCTEGLEQFFWIINGIKMFFLFRYIKFKESYASALRIGYSITDISSQSTHSPVPFKFPSYWIRHRLSTLVWGLTFPVHSWSRFAGATQDISLESSVGDMCVCVSGGEKGAVRGEVQWCLTCRAKQKPIPPDKGKCASEEKGVAVGRDSTSASWLSNSTPAAQSWDWNSIRSVERGRQNRLFQ